jgi:hypothetical protein
MHLINQGFNPGLCTPTRSSSDPSSYYPSPISSPAPLPLPLPGRPESTTWEELPNGFSRWRNPNWRTPTPVSQTAEDEDDDVVSCASTELISADENVPQESEEYSPVSPITHRKPFMLLHTNSNGIPLTHRLPSPSSSGNDIFNDDNHSYSDSDPNSMWSTDSFLNDTLRDSLPLATVFHTHRRNYAQIQEAAQSRGYSIGLLTRPSIAPVPTQSYLSSKVELMQSEQAIWLVVGQSQEAVGHLIDMQRSLLPWKTNESEEANNRLIWWNFYQQYWALVKMIIAGAIGGLVAVYGLNMCR